MTAHLKTSSDSENPERQYDQLFSREEAIEAFRSYNWSEDMAGSTWTFTSAEKGTLEIHYDGGSDYYILLRKEGKIGEEFFATDKNYNTSGTAIEDFIAAYYDGDLDKHMTMFEEDKEKPHTRYKLEFSFSERNKLRYYFNPLCLIALAPVLAWMNSRGNIKTGVALILPIAVFLFLFGPGTILLINYYRHDMRKKVSLDPAGKKITIEKDGKIVSFKTDQIEACRIFLADRGAMHFVLFKLKSGAAYSVTSLVAEPEELLAPMRIRVEYLKKFLPFVPQDRDQ
jgi:hypothetical protein